MDLPLRVQVVGRSSALTATTATATATATAAALTWAERLREKKIHVVATVLDLVGQDAMTRIATDARVVHGRGEARSLGGAFMRVIKKVVVATENGDETLHDVAKRLSGEWEYQRERAKRKRRQSAVRGPDRSIGSHAYPQR